LAFIVLFSFTKVVGLFGPDVKFMHVDTNCENVIPEIAFEPCSHRETLKRRKMRESVFSFSLFHTPHADRSIRLSSTHHVKVYREVSAEFLGCHRPREKFNMRFASNLFAHERVRECEKVIRRVRMRMIRRHEVRKSWNWRILYAKLRETILICRCELEMSL